MKQDLENNNYLYIVSIKSLDYKDKYEEAYNNLSNQRKQKVNKLISLDDKKRSVLAEMLLRKALDDLFITSNFEYGYNEYGKPFLKDNKNIHFSISHSGEYVICVLSKNEVGCDIQEIKDVNIKGISKYFTDNEYISIKNSPNQKELFYRYWVAKESYMKLIGKGYTINSKEFEISINTEILLNNSNKYFFKEIYINEYKCCICLINNNQIIISHYKI